MEATLLKKGNSMGGTIHFKTLEELAEFMRHFTPCTATFEVVGNARGWTLTFTGGY